MRVALCVLAGAATGFVALALWNGQDANWDLQNYHIYDAFALLHWRYARDVIPGGPQTTLNPVPYLLPYLLNQLLPPRFAAAFLAVIQSLAVFLAWCVATRAARTRWIAVTATIVAATTSMVLAEVGTSFEELLMSIPALGSVYVLVEPNTTCSGPRQRAYVFAGCLTGVAVGFKITLLPLAFGLVCAIAAATARHARFAALLQACAGLALGFLLSGGAWAAALWWHFGNPFFPFLNNIFRSAAADPISFGDSNAYFRGLGTALFRPFEASFVGISAPIDVPFRDARPLAGLLMAVAWLLARPRNSTDPIYVLSVYLLCGEAAWLVLCPIERYALTLDLIAGMLAILATAALVRGRRAIVISVALAILLVGSTRPSDFFHRPWAPRYAAHPPSAVGSDYDLVLLGPPLGYWVSASPSPNAAFGLFGELLRRGGLLQRRLDAGLNAARDRLWAVGIDRGGVDGAERKVMERFDIALSPPCARAESVYWTAAVFCRAMIVPPRLNAASDLATGSAVDFTVAGYGWIYESGDWGPTQTDGTWATGRTPMLIFRNTDERPLVVELVVQALATMPMRKIRITAGGRTSAPVVLDGMSAPMRIGACVGPQRGFGKVVTARFSAEHVDAMAISSESGAYAFLLSRMGVRDAAVGECSHSAGSTEDPSSEAIRIQDQDGQ